MRPNTSREDRAQPAITSQDVEDAYQAFAALQRLSQAERQLARNDYFIALQETAFARFLLAYEAL